MRFSIALIFTFLLSACSGYQQFYKPYTDAKTMPDVELLAEGQEPKVYSSEDLERDVNIIRSKNYIVIGHSSFNGQYEDTSNAVAQAKKVGATLVLIKTEYTNTETNVSTLYMPDTKTTNHSGTVSGNTTYNSADSGYLGSSNTSGMYSGTSTTYGTKAVPITTQTRRYDQTAVYFVKSTKKHKVGVTYKDLTPDLRAKINRNTGALITIVYEDSPAFYSNVLAGDVLIKINGETVNNHKHVTQLFQKHVPNNKTVVLTVIRSGEIKDITVQL